MTRIGLISDTHNYFDPRFYDLFSNVDQIWHAGDVGDERVIDAISGFKPYKAVYGNIDGTPVRSLLPEHNRFMCEDVDVWITHIGGYPGKYAPGVVQVMKSNPPKLFIAGHSHILKVIFDDKYNCLHMNPGACGLSGFHTVRTALRFAIDGKDIKDLEVIELGVRR
jgi:putative phosphoesterase